MRNPVAKVQTITTGETFGADVAVMNQVIQKDTSRDAQHIILFCPITSRVGSDVETALGKVPYGRRVILVLMHHTRDADYSTAGIKWSDCKENVVLDVHVLFHESVPGLLSCAQNRKAVLQIRNFLEGHKKSTDQNWQNWYLVRSGYWLFFCVFSWVLSNDRSWMRLLTWFWHPDRILVRLVIWFGTQLSHLISALVFHARKPKVIKDRLP